MSEVALSVLLLTEDSGQDGHATAEALARCMLRLVDPAHDAAKVRIDPIAEEKVRRASQASFWKSQAEHHREDLRQLCQRIATQLVLPRTQGFVFYHVDGDRTWSERASADHPTLFRQRIVTKVRKILEERKRMEGTALSHTLSRLFLLMPFYSIESWVFQNSREAITILHDEHGGSHVDLFERWATDRTLLDEIAQPKGASVTPLRDRYNRRLAERGYPAASVRDAARSFSACVDRLAASTELVEALARAR